MNFLDSGLVPVLDCRGNKLRGSVKGREILV